MEEKAQANKKTKHSGDRIMGKPIIFFSHSSKDKELVMAIKRKMEKATNGVLDFFVSSDGQSVPFGSNWVHKIEEKLKTAQIMFVFITENSVKSGWIYFEAGFAYSKGMMVIPIGIGVEVESLKAPLNLLQGFNISSSDSLNNLISIINSHLDYSFPEAFDDQDYSEIIKCFSQLMDNSIAPEDILAYEEYELKSEYLYTDGTIETYDIEGFFKNVICYLEEKDIRYSVEEKDMGLKMSQVVTQGLQIVYYHGREKRPDSQVDQGEKAKIRFRISPYNFQNCFSMFTKLMKLCNGDPHGFIDMYLMKNVGCLTVDEDISSIISAYPEEYIPNKTHIGWYDCVSQGLSFRLLEKPRPRGNGYVYTIAIRYDFDKNDTVNVIRLLNKLYEIKLIQVFPETDG